MICCYNKTGGIMNIEKLYNLNETIAKDYLLNYDVPWKVLPNIKNIILDIGKTLSDDYIKIDENIWISKTAYIEKTVLIKGPCKIGHNSEIRHCAYIRENVLIGNNCIVGNSVELKNVILFNDVSIPHYNYVGDSILGYKVHMGALSITSNVKGNKSLVKINNIDTGLKKVGAFLGDYAEIGCSCVLNPGTIIGKNTQVYPLNSVREIISENSIYKNYKNIIKKENV